MKRKITVYRDNGLAYIYENVTQIAWANGRTTLVISQGAHRHTYLLRERILGFTDEIIPEPVSTAFTSEALPKTFKGLIQ